MYGSVVSVVNSVISCEFLYIGYMYKFLVLAFSFNFKVSNLIRWVFIAFLIVITKQTARDLAGLLGEIVLVQTIHFNGPNFNRPQPTSFRSLFSHCSANINRADMIQVMREEQFNCSLIQRLAAKGFDRIETLVLQFEGFVLVQATPSVKVAVKRGTYIIILLLLSSKA